MPSPIPRGPLAEGGASSSRASGRPGTGCVAASPSRNSCAGSLWALLHSHRPAALAAGAASLRREARSGARTAGHPSSKRHTMARYPFIIIPFASSPSPTWRCWGKERHHSVSCSGISCRSACAFPRLPVTMRRPSSNIWRRRALAPGTDPSLARLDVRDVEALARGRCAASANCSLRSAGPMPSRKA